MARLVWTDRGVHVQTGNRLVWTDGGAQVETAGGGASITLVGVAGTGAVGSFVPEIDVTSTSGVFGTATAGTFAGQINFTLSGVFGAGVGAGIVPEADVALAGVFGAGAVGILALTISSSVALPGVFATGAVGSFAFGQALILDIHPELQRHSPGAPGHQLWRN